MQQVRGQVVHCTRFGCLVRLEDGRFGILPAAEQGVDDVRRALASGRRPSYPFGISEDNGRHVRLSLASGTTSSSRDERPPGPGEQKFSASLEQKIIDFWRQVSEWDRNAGRVETEDMLRQRRERLLPFEERVPRQHRDLPNKSRKGPKPTRRNRS